MDSFLHITWEPYFSKTCCFCRTIKANMVHPSNQKKSTHQPTKYFVKPYLWGIFGHYPPNELFFSEESDCQYFTFRSLQLYVEFQKKATCHSAEKKCLPTVILTYWHTDLMTSKNLLSPKARCLKINFGNSTIFEIIKFQKSLWTCLDILIWNYMINLQP